MTLLLGKMGAATGKKKLADFPLSVKFMISFSGQNDGSKAVTYFIHDCICVNLQYSFYDLVTCNVNRVP